MSSRDTVALNVKKSTSLLASAVALPLILGFSASAMATNGILPIGNGISAHGLGGAGIANAEDAMAGTDNPALLARTGDQMSAGLTFFAPFRSASISPTAGYVDSEENLFFIPSFGWTKSLSPKMNTGILVTAMGGMNTSYPKDLLQPMLGPGSDKFGIDLSGLIIAPTLSYAPSNDLSLGVSLLLGYEKLTTTLPLAMQQFYNLKDGTDSATGSGIKLGIVKDLDDSMTIGAFYQSRIKMSEMSLHCDDGVFKGAKYQLKSQCEVNLPPIAGVGFNIKTSQNSKIVMDLIDAAWSKVELFRQGFGWEDQNILKMGVEVQQSSTFTWKIGYNYAPQPVNPEYLSIGGQLPGVMAPAVTEFHYTFGFTMKMGKNELVGYYAYIPEVEVQDPTETNVKVKMYQHALGVGFNWK